MFRENTKHLEKGSTEDLDKLPPAQRKRLEEGWAGTFYRECFCRIDEEPFAVLYSDEPSRPNVPVNILLGLEILKAGFAWTDEEMVDAFTYNLQVRYALGCRDLDHHHLTLRSVYNFRRRLLEHYRQTGEDLWVGVFEQVTDEQLEAWQLQTDKVRIDSTMIASNIHDYSRLELLVEVLARVYRMLCEFDQARYQELFGAYVRQDAQRFVYGVSSEEGKAHIAAIGQVMAQLATELASQYGDDRTYGLLVRVLDEQFTRQEEQVAPRAMRGAPGDLLASPDDPEATYRRKRGTRYKGYVTNLGETCNPLNPFQLIVSVQTEPNVTSDTHLLQEILFPLKRRLDLHDAFTDGGYNKEEIYFLTHGLGIEHWQTGIQGHASTTLLPRHCYTFLRSKTGALTEVRCPQGGVAPVQPGRRPGRYVAHFALEGCAGCPHRENCLAERCKTYRSLRFRDYDVELAERRQRIVEHDPGLNLRAAIEGTVRGVKCRFGEKLPVRERWRVHSLMVASALMFNIRRMVGHKRPHFAPAEAQQLSAVCSFSLFHWLRLSLKTLEDALVPVPTCPGQP